jgi:hypothetical protein
VDEVVEVLEQAGRPSWWTSIRRMVGTIQLPVALGAAVLTALLHHGLGWRTSWAGPLLPTAFHVAACAVLPYLDPLGLDRNGQVQGHFLTRHRMAFLWLGAVASCLALLSAARLGNLCVIGLLALVAAAAFHQRLGHGDGPSRIQDVPALKDVGQALAPALLAIVLPAWRRSSSFGACAAAFMAVFCLALMVHSLRHLHAFREDRVLGREILPVAIGSSATRWVAVALLTGGLGSLVSVTGLR